jgi:hypothetical protein
MAKRAGTQGKEGRDMRPEVELLASDSGGLIAITGRAVAGDRFAALLLEFGEGTLELTCDDDTDEVVASVIEGGPDHQDVVGHNALTDLAGLELEYAWELRNHRGYVDGFQLRFTGGDGREETRQFEVAGSAMDVYRVTR